MLDTSLKAIHNYPRLAELRYTMYMPYVRYKFESNSQLEVVAVREVHGCICHMLDTSLKAIHNMVQRGQGMERDVYAIC